MKKCLLTLWLIGLVAGAFGQGQISLDNLANTDNTSWATSNGKFFFCTDATPELAYRDFNVSFYGGSDANSLALLRTFAQASAVGGNAFGPGTFVDPTGISVTIPGAITTAFFRIEAWTGSSPTFFGAYLDFRGQSPVFSNPVSTLPNPPTSFVNMPAIRIGYPECIPEPSTFALAGIGAVALLVFHRRNACKRKNVRGI